MVRHVFRGAAALLALASASAQSVDDPDVQTFSPAYFERFAPQTALDMLNQVPGFSIRTSGGGRGLGQGGTNVLINGARVTSKDTNVTDILSRSPAATVVRIEIADAASLGVTGLSGQVANVVLDRSNLSGSYEYRASFRKDVRPLLTSGGASISGSKGALDFTLGFDNDSWRGFEEGFERVFEPDLTLREERFERVSTRVEVPRVTMSLNYDMGPKTALAINGSGTLFSFEGRERSDPIGDSPGNIRRASDQEHEWNADLAAELTRELGPGSFKLIGSQRYENSPFDSDILIFAPSGSQERAFFSREDDEGESIGRAEYAWVRPGGVSWEFAGETAFNFLESASTLRSVDGTGETLEVNPEIRVEELRHQASITRGFNLWDSLAVQASAAGEWSRIAVTSDGQSQDQTFLRPKGFVSLAYPMSPSMDLRGRFERTVGQLSFGQFVSSVNLIENVERTGNTTLRPEQAWEAELELEQRFSEEEKVILRVVGRRIEDKIEEGIVDGGAAAVNVDEPALSILFRGEGTVLTDRWSLPGGRIDFVYSRFGSEVEDQVEFNDRAFNNASDWFYEVDFRQDIPSTPYAWGVGTTGEDDTINRRFDLIQKSSESTPGYRAFVEHKDLFGLNLRVSAFNLSNRDYDFERVIYAGNRVTEPVAQIEQRSRIDNRRLQVVLSGTF